MKIVVDDFTIDQIAAIIDNQNETEDTNVRVYIAGMSCSGPAFGLALDKKTDEDLVYESSKLTFVMEKELYDRFGDIVIESVGEGFRVMPTDPSLMGGGCSSCGGGCH